MSVLTKKHRTEKDKDRAEIVFKQGRRSISWVGPRNKIRLVQSFIGEMDFHPAEKPEKGIPWREVAKEDIEKYTEPGLMLRGARGKEGLTQVQLAKKLGIPQSHISAMESGSRPIGKAMAKRLAKVLNIDYRVFL